MNLLSILFSALTVSGSILRGGVHDSSIGFDCTKKNETIEEIYYIDNKFVMCEEFNAIARARVEGMTTLLSKQQRLLGPAPSGNECIGYDNVSTKKREKENNYLIPFV